MDHNQDGDTNLAEPMKNREIDTIVKTWDSIHTRLVNNRIATSHCILDNECSLSFQNTLKEKVVTFELVPPNQHR